MADLGPSIRVLIEYVPAESAPYDGRKWGASVALGAFTRFTSLTSDLEWDDLAMRLSEIVEDTIRDEVKEYARERSNG